MHYFVNKAILELALTHCSAVDAGERIAAFWEETDRLRDFFKFEFFYSPKPKFRKQLQAEMSMYVDDWKAVLAGDGQGIISMLREMRPLVAHATLLPYVEAYWIVAEILERLEPGAGIEEKDCVAQSLKLGQQRYLQRRISSKASIAKLLFANA